MASFEHALDPGRGLLVVLFRTEIPKEEQESLITTIDGLYASRANLTRDLVFVNVVPEGVMPGTSTFRRRLADARARTLNEERAIGATRRTLLSVVSSSPLMRAAATALDWLHPPPPELMQTFVATFDEAVRFSERQRGEPLPELRTMYAKLTSEPRRRS